MPDRDDIINPKDGTIPNEIKDNTVYISFSEVDGGITANVFFKSLDPSLFGMLIFARGLLEAGFDDWETIFNIGADTIDTVHTDNKSIIKYGRDNINADQILADIDNDGDANDDQLDLLSTIVKGNA